MESMREERGMEDEEMEGFGEEEEEQEEEVNEEVAEERRPLQGRPIGNLIIYSIFRFLELAIYSNSISQKPLGLPSASRERAAWRSGSPASSAAAASPTAWSGNVTSCATACECVFAHRTRPSGLLPIFPQTRGALSWVCVCGRIPGACVRGTALQSRLRRCSLSLLPFHRQGGEHRPDGHQHRRRALGSVFRRFFCRHGRGVGAARQPKRRGGVLTGKPERVCRRRREARHQKGSRV